MSKILISGCGLTFSGERPTWTKVLKLAGADMLDLSGPAISNTLILNNLLSALYTDATFSHVICQLTSMGKLDVELNNNNRFLMETDSIRNFSFQGYWPSSVSLDNDIKKNWKEYLYSPSLEEQDVIFKCLLLEKLCEEKNIPLLILLGYDIDWTNPLHTEVTFNEYIIYNEYKKDPSYDPKNNTPANNVPVTEFQIRLAKHINAEFLKLELPKLEKFNV